jgi:hypothetical protein
VRLKPWHARRGEGAAVSAPVSPRSTGTWPAGSISTPDRTDGTAPGKSWSKIPDVVGAWLRKLNTESVGTFQTLYYLIFSSLGVALLVPGIPIQHAERIMEPALYWFWVGLNLACPILSLVGRRMMSHAAHAIPGTPNLSITAAWLQLGGDWGVWISVQLWTISMFFTTWWTHNLYVLCFMIMGLGGGAMFTLRSLLRLLAIRARK